MVRTAPALFVFCLVQIGVHLAIILAAGRVMRFSRRDVLLASNANVGGETVRERAAALALADENDLRACLCNGLPCLQARVIAIAIVDTKHSCCAGPTTAAGMCVAKGWRTSMVPSLLIGTAGQCTPGSMTFWSQASRGGPAIMPRSMRIGVSDHVLAAVLLFAAASFLHSDFSIVTCRVCCGYVPLHTPWRTRASKHDVSGFITEGMKHASRCLS